MAISLTDPKTGVVFNNYLEPGLTTGGHMLARVEPNARDQQDHFKNCVVNALDIWWDGVNIANTPINTTGELIEAIQKIADESIVDAHVDAQGVLHIYKGNGEHSTGGSVPPGNVGGGEGSSGSQMFMPDSSDDATVPETIGDIKAGMTVAELKNMTVSQILDMILIKTIYPSITTQPSLIINGMSTTLVEAGSSLLNLSCDFKQGTIAIGSESQAYLGTKKEENWEVSINSAAYVPINNVERYEPGKYTYRVTVVYDAGEVFHDSKGKETNPMQLANGTSVANPAPAGSMNTSKTLDVSLPVWIDKQDGKGYTKQTLKAWGAMTFSSVIVTDTNRDKIPIKIKTPRKINSIMAYDPFDKVYNIDNMGKFNDGGEPSTIYQDVNGKKYTYYEYTWTGGVQSDLNLEITTV